MAQNMLIREVPQEIADWIRDKREESLQTQNEFVLNVLRDAYDSDTSNQLQLFPPKPRLEIVPGSLPFTFIDLFAGIGGLRLGLEKVGGRCVFSCEWDRHAQKTYKSWFGEVPHGDIREIDVAAIPDHDVLAAGFPCQPFSIAGVSKKQSLGREHGFRDRTQGTLFFHLATIIEQRRPPVLLLENVKNLKSHDKGRTWSVIRGTLSDLDYLVFDKVIDAAGWVPQHRERVFIIAFDRRVFGTEIEFTFPDPPKGVPPKLSSILDPEPDARYTLSSHLWRYLKDYAERHRAKGNGFGYGIANPDGVTRTLSARYYKDGSEILVRQGGKKNPRRLTPRECARLMGFPEDLEIVVSDTQAYRQFGNAVVPPVAAAVGQEIVRVMAEELAKDGSLFRKNAGSRISAAG